MKIETVADLENAVRELDPNLSGDAPAFLTAAILLACLVVGANARKVARFTGYPIGQVEKRFVAMRKNGIVKRGRVYANWFDEDSGGIAFWCDVAVADGLMERTR